MASNTTDQRLKALDGLRGIAILTVITIHSTMWIVPSNLYEKVFKWVFAGTWGTISIDLFYTLSGYLITRVLLRIHGKPYWLQSFYYRRILRIAPLYYLSLFLLLVVLPNTSVLWAKTIALKPEQHVWFYAMIVNYNNALFIMPYAHYWSLCLEMHFYLLWPLVIYLFEGKALIRATLGIILATTLIRWGMVYADVSPAAVYIRTHSRMDVPIYGALIAILEHNMNGLRGYRNLAKRIMMVTGAGMLFLALYNDRLFSYSQAALGFTFNGFFFSSLLVFVLQEKQDAPMLRVFEHPFLRACGKYSYGMYIFHAPLLYMVSLIVHGLSPARAATAITWPITWTIMLWVTTVTLAFLSGFLSWHLLEKHCLRIRLYAT